jgi:hypothetical protein
MSNLERPTNREEIGTFNKVRYVRYRGRFTGETTTAGKRSGPYSVPYEINAPADPAEGNGRLVVEPPHFSNGLLVRKSFGPEFFFGRGFSYASVGYGAWWWRILEPAPGFQTVVAGTQFTPTVPPAPPVAGAPALYDVEIIAQFVQALGQNALDLLGDLRRVYGVGQSDSGNALHVLLRSAFGRGLFALSLPYIGGYSGSLPVLEGVGRIIFFNTESDFRDALNVGDSPDYRRYVAAGCPHIPDTEHSRETFPDPPLPGSPAPPVAGTTPLDWTPFAKALFLAGDDWVVKGKEPPPNALLELADGQPKTDEKGNTRGGIRHPALEVGEALFIAEKRRGFWENFGDYERGSVSTVGGPGFFKNFGQYVKAFDAAARELKRAGFLLDEDEKELTRKAKLNPQSTFTQNYMARLF